MLDDTIREQLRSHLGKITRPIVLRASLDDGAKSHELEELLTEVASLSDAVSYERTDDDARRPSFAVARRAADVGDVGVRFAGIPGGHEFTSFVLALLHVGGYPPVVAPGLVEQIEQLDGEYRFETYMSLSCQNCPDVVQALNVLSVLNPRVQHVAIDGALFPDEVSARKIQAVPTVYLNGELFDQGRMTLEQIVAKLDTGSTERERARIDALEPFDVLIVGGGPAGAAAAIYAARKGIRTGLVAERFGGQVLDTLSIENLVSVPGTDGPKLATALESHVNEYDVDVMQLQRATRLVPAADDGLTTIELDVGASVQARTVVLATGARWRQLHVPGEDEYRNRGVTFCPHCDGPLFANKRVAVVGGGNSGVEAAIDLAGVVAHVTLLEFDDRLRADAVLQAKLCSLPNVDVIVHARTTEILGDGTTVVGLEYEDRETGEPHRIDLDGVFVQIGLLPNTDWLRGTVELSPQGEIVVDGRGATSVPGVFAAGDCTTVPYKQIVVALGAGATAALSAFDHLIRASAPNTRAAA